MINGDFGIRQNFYTSSNLRSLPVLKQGHGQGLELKTKAFEKYRSQGHNPQGLPTSQACRFLADRTNGRATGRVLRLSVCL